MGIPRQTTANDWLSLRPWEPGLVVSTHRDTRIESTATPPARRLTRSQSINLTSTKNSKEAAAHVVPVPQRTSDRSAAKSTETKRGPMAEKTLSKQTKNKSKVITPVQVVLAKKAPSQRAGRPWTLATDKPGWQPGLTTITVHVTRPGFPRGLTMHSGKLGYVDETRKPLSQLGICEGFTLTHINNTPIVEIASWLLHQ